MLIGRKFTFKRRLDGGSSGDGNLLRTKNPVGAIGQSHRVDFRRIYNGGELVPVVSDL